MERILLSVSVTDFPGEPFPVTPIYLLAGTFDIVTAYQATAQRHVSQKTERE